MSEFDNFNETENNESAQETVREAVPAEETSSVCEENQVVSENPIPQPENTTPFYQNYAAYREAINYSPKKPKPEKNKGVRVFALILALVIALTASCYVGYISGTSNKTGKDYSSADLSARPNDENTLTTAEVYEKVNPAVVGITVYNISGVGTSATGVIYSEDGYIITNDHIYSSVPNAKFKITDYDGNEYDAEFIAGDTRSDIAILKCEDLTLSPAVFGNSDDIIIGEGVCALGRPDAVEDNSLTCGIISLKSRRLQINTSYNMNLIQTDTPINPGNSGGALVNMYGQVIGITSSKIADTAHEGIGFAIPTVTACRVADSLIKNGNVDFRGKLAISYNEITSVTAELNSIPVTGVYVAAIDEESDLYGKVEVGDIITSVNGAEITTDNVLLDVIENGTVGDELILGIYTKEGKTKTVTGKTIPDPGSSSYTVD